jgi:hypothetical protein
VCCPFNPDFSSVEDSIAAQMTSSQSLHFLNSRVEKRLSALDRGGIFEKGVLCSVIGEGDVTAAD